MEVSIQFMMTKYEEKILSLTRESIVLAAEKNALEEQMQILMNEIKELKEQQELPKEKKDDSKSLEK